jgi:hypothetical protein
MSENYLVKKDLYSMLQQKEKEILRLQENPDCVLDMCEGLPHQSSYYSSSSIVVCSQILKPTNHVHFEEYSTLEAFLANITDIEYQWFAQKCTDRTRTTMADWEEGYFFNLKSVVHYRKFGDAIYKKMGHANPIRLMETLEMAHLQGNRAKVFNLLTSSQIICPYSSPLEVEFETPQVNMAPSLADASLVKLDKENKEIDSAVGASVCGGALWSGLGSFGLPSSWLELPPQETKELREKNPCILTSAKIEPKYDLVVSTKECDLDFQKKGLQDVTSILEAKKDVFGKRVHVIEKKGKPKLRFSHGSDVSYEDQMVDVPFSIPTISSIRWLTHVEKLPTLNLFLPVLCGGTFYFHFLGDTLFWVSDRLVRLKRDVEIVQRYCSCEKNKKGIVCQKCGIRVKYKGLFISFFHKPLPEDSYVVRHPVFSAFPSSYLGKDTGEMGISYLGKKIRSDLAVVNFPDTWPYPSSLGSPPAGYLMRSFSVPMHYIFEPQVPFFHVQTGAQMMKKNFLPVELIYLFQKVPENLLGHLIMIYLVWYEENLSFYDLYRKRGEREKEAYDHSRIDHQDYILASKQNIKKN